jgi:hypothetical protein
MADLKLARQLGPHPSAVVHPDACALASLPDRRKVQPAHRCPAPILGWLPASPARWTAATQCASVSRSALPADPADPRPGAAQPDEDGAFDPDYLQVIGQQNPSLPVSLTWAWCWRVGLARSSRVGLRLRPRLGVVFPGGYSADALTEIRMTHAPSPLANDCSPKAVFTRGASRLSSLLPPPLASPGPRRAGHDAGQPPGPVRRGPGDGAGR